jgi:serine/threonine-protein phosphatase 2A regulatory subunit B''
MAELETKRILLEAFKERQQKNAQAGVLPTFYKKVLLEILTLAA